MAVLGMGTVFLMLIVLMLALKLLNRTDAKTESSSLSGTEIDLTEEETAPPVITFRDPSGLTQDQISAIAVAVAIHADVRRKQAAPVNRVHAPGSRLWASRWVSMGRTSQMNNTQRR